MSLPSKLDDNSLSNANPISSPSLNASSDYDQFDVSFFRSRVSGLRDDEIYDMVKSVFVHIFTSKTTQNKLITCCGRLISETIVARSNSYSILADEACD